MSQTAEMAHPFKKANYIFRERKELQARNHYTCSKSLRYFTEIFRYTRSQLVQRIPDRQEPPPLWVEDENEDNKAGDHSETGQGHQSHALQHWGRHMTERRRQQDFISRESVWCITHRVKNVFFSLSELMCMLKILMKYI